MRRSTSSGEPSSGGPGRTGWGTRQPRPAPSSDLGHFSQLPSYIVKVLSTICFIWATSEHYNTPSRVIVILREFCNQIIEMVTPVPGPALPHAPVLPAPQLERNLWGWGSFLRHFPSVPC